MTRRIARVALAGIAAAALTGIATPAQAEWCPLGTFFPCLPEVSVQPICIDPTQTTCIAQPAG